MCPSQILWHLTRFLDVSAESLRSMLQNFLACSLGPRRELLGVLGLHAHLFCLDLWTDHSGLRAGGASRPLEVQEPAKAIYLHHVLL